MAIPQAILFQEAPIRAIDYWPAAAVSGGELVQLRDGRAAVIHSDAAAGQKTGAIIAGIYKVPKTANIVLLDGGELYWDHSANTATYQPNADRDYYLGTIYGDAAASDEYVYFDLNAKPSYLTDLVNGAFRTVIVGTEQATGRPQVMPAGGSIDLRFNAHAEAQKLDLISDRSWAKGSKAIVRARFTVIDDGDDAAIDFNIGVANATHASDADAITESLFLHTDGDSTQVNAESDDGTTEVAATDTTVDYVLGTPVEVWFDLRNLEDIQVYINGVLVLGSTVFKLNAATGPLKLLAHLEKSSNDTTAHYCIDALDVRIAEQGTNAAA